MKDLNQGQLHVAGTSVPTLVAHHKTGTAKMLFVTNRARSPQGPDVPTAAEAGFPDLTFEGTVGLYGGRDMTDEARRRIAADVNTIIADPAFHARAVGVGVLPRRGTPEEFARAIEEQRAK